MKIYIKQKILTLPDKFYVKDINGKNIYSVEAEILSSGKRLHIYNTKSEEVGFLKQKIWSLMPRYEVLINGKKEAEIKRLFNFLKPKYIVEGPDWIVSGDFSSHNYTITQNEKIVVKISKKWMSFSGDSYELDIQDTHYELLALCVVLAIDTDIQM